MTMIPTQQAFNHIVAFEVSKDMLVVHTLPADEQCTILNKPQAVRRLLKAELKRNRKERLGAVLIVCEARRLREACPRCGHRSRRSSP